MNVSFFFGPDKIPFELKPRVMVENTATIPFHGIISRGLMNAFMSHDVSKVLWHRYAPMLYESSIRDDTDLNLISNFALSCKVLSYGQSAFCALIYVERYCNQHGEDESEIELWNIKEGHTSSVWKVSINSKKKRRNFCIKCGKRL